MGKLKHAIAQNLGGGDSAPTIKHAPMVFTACDTLVEVPLAAPSSPRIAPQPSPALAPPASAPVLSSGGASVFEGLPLGSTALPNYVAAPPRSGLAAGLEAEEDEEEGQGGRVSGRSRMSV